MRLRAKGVQLLDEALAGIGAKNAAAKQDTQTAQDRYFAMLLGALPEQQRLATITSNPDWRTTGKINIPDYQQTDQEKFDAMVAQKNLQNFPTLSPEQLNAGTYQSAFKAAQPKELTEEDINRQNMSQPDFAKAIQIGGGLAMNAKDQNAADFTQKKYDTIDLPTSSANIGHMKAMTVERLAAAGNQRAQTGKNAEETINERAKRDPTSPVSPGYVKPTAAAAPVDVGTDKNIKTTVSGKQYVDLTGYTGKASNEMRQRYSDAGLPVVSGPTADVINEIDNARMNQKTIQDMIASKLPKGPGGRVVAMPGIKLSQIFQTDADRAAYGIARSAAIQTLRAVAGSKGLRINRAEIIMASENDIPQITDTIDTANTRTAFIGKLLDGTENAHLVRDKSAPGAASSSKVIRYDASGKRIQ